MNVYDIVQLFVCNNSIKSIFPMKYVFSDHPPCINSIIPWILCNKSIALVLAIEEICWSTENFTPPSRSEFAILLSNLCWMEYQFILHPAKLRAVLHQISSKAEEILKKNTAMIFGREYVIILNSPETKKDTKY